mmetsp:Transcript_18809/g.38291  ORF Transcript_18809/g.38291 Transcript_18809/m.38291 type:complete len:200 (+) Transcript_18809:59-658(+)
MAKVACVLLCCAVADALITSGDSSSCVRDRALGRRELLGALSALTGAPLLAGAYDTIETQKADFAAMEKKRLAREALAAKNEARIEPYLQALQLAQNETTFSDAADSLSVWLVGEPSLPEGLEAPRIRDAIKESYDSLPMLYQYRCAKTRDNGGVCLTPGFRADDAYKTALTTLRSKSTMATKGTLQSDGVSAANSAAF